MATPPINAAGLALVEKFEGLDLNAYQDVVGVWTIGYGHTSGVTPGETITEQQADDFLQSDLQSAGAAVLAALPGVGLTGNQYAALTSLVFNVGPGALEGTNLAAYIKAGNWPAAYADWLNFDHAGGRVVQGLLNRRQAEVLLAQTPDGPATASGWVVVIGTSINAQLFGDTAYGPLRAMFEALYGAETDNALAWDAATQTATWNGQSTGFTCRLINGSAWAPIRPFAAFVGCNVNVDGETITLSH